MTQEKREKKERKTAFKKDAETVFLKDEKAEDADGSQFAEMLAEKDYTDCDEAQLAELLLQMGKEKESLEEQLLRLQADFDNFRKRTRQEKETLVALANAELVKVLLPVVDNLSRGINFGQGDASSKEAFVEGMQMILRQLTSLLATAGLEEIEAMGKDFDPNFHEAVMQESAGEENCGKVTAELQKGYLFGGRLLRPVMVKVGE